MPILVDDIEIKSKTLDFSSSGMGQFNGHALWVNGMEFFNAIELLDFSSGRFQTHLCSCCGFEGCEPGSWAALRRFGKYILLVPAIEAMSEGEWERNEYAPPYFLRKYGVPAFTVEQYDSLVESHSKFPLSALIPPLNNAELISILQLEAPGRVLGEVAMQAKLNTDPIIAVEDGMLDDEKAAFEKLLAQRDSQEEAVCTLEADTKVKFILDLPGFPVWVPMVYVNGKPSLFAEIIG